MHATSAKAFARAALAGNPSDGYGGRTVAVCVADWCAEAELHPDPGPAPAGHGPEIDQLVEAALARVARMTNGAELRGSVSVRTSIPRQVGLGGSSAVVIAVMRVAAAAQSIELAPAVLAREDGAAVNYAGSGGAVAALPAEGREADLVHAFTDAGWAARRIRVATADEPNGARATSQVPGSTSLD